MGASIKSNDYTISLKSPSVEEFSDLRRKIGWGDTDFEMAKSSLDNSLFHVVIRDQSKLIGIGRVIGDGSMYFYIQDVIVDPDYQKHGIGTAIMERIESHLLEVAITGSTIGLMVAKGKESFYSRYGYLERPSGSLGKGMCKFI